MEVIVLTKTYCNHFFNIDHCALRKCQYYSKCTHQVDGSTKCVCPYCARNEQYMAICGDDGRTYANECRIKQMSCLTKRNIRIAKAESCGKLTMKYLRQIFNCASKVSINWFDDVLIYLSFYCLSYFSRWEYVDLHQDLLKICPQFRNNRIFCRGGIERWRRWESIFKLLVIFRFIGGTGHHLCCWFFRKRNSWWENVDLHQDLLKTCPQFWNNRFFCRGGIERWRGWVSIFKLSVIFRFIGGTGHHLCCWFFRKRNSWWTWPYQKLCEGCFKPLYNLSR